ncbi:hypothetical protein BC827DRAFT_73124 [Russula dissimulans]|nr:hypothetical protein BC827DRAFT_73124 [Russula dissimulans]
MSRGPYGQDLKSLDKLVKVRLHSMALLFSRAQGCTSCTCLCPRGGLGLQGRPLVTGVRRHNLRVNRRNRIFRERVSHRNTSHYTRRLEFILLSCCLYSLASKPKWPSVVEEGQPRAINGAPVLCKLDYRLAQPDIIFCQLTSVSLKDSLVITANSTRLPSQNNGLVQ